jgi:hypothetical protein
LSIPSTLQVVYRWDSPSGAEEDFPEDKKASRNDDPATGGGGDGIEMGAASGRPYNRVENAPVGLEDDDIKSVEELRALPTEELIHRLETILCDLISRVGGELTPPVDPDAPLVSMGLDSMSIIQFKGVLDNRLEALYFLILLTGSY